MPAVRAPRNKTLQCSNKERKSYLKTFLPPPRRRVSISGISNQLLCADIAAVAGHLPPRFVDFLFLDPPYNLTKDYNGKKVTKQREEEYAAWFEDMLRLIRHTLKPQATVYVCADWRTSVIIAPILQRFFHVHSRITWERGKGRGAKTNWKNNIEDIWFCSVGAEYYFNVEAVKVKRRVVAPYKHADGSPKDWKEEEGGNYRLTHPSNIWTDISIPFWSMVENTDHPTQKPEKLLAKLLLASSRPGDMVFDPFAGSGTAAVVAKKLGRRYVAVELNEEYCCWAAKRLAAADSDKRIQGYSDGIFWERNSLQEQGNKTGAIKSVGELF